MIKACAYSNRSAHSDIASPTGACSLKGLVGRDKTRRTSNLAARDVLLKGNELLVRRLIRCLGRSPTTSISWEGAPEL